MEYCQAHRVEPPKFAFEQHGPPHLPVITCTASCAGHQSSARASAKQEAKRAAVVALLSHLRTGAVDVSQP